MEQDTYIISDILSGDLKDGVSAVSGQSSSAVIQIMFLALVISMIIIPLMVRLAPRLGMVDQPDFRKVHVTPIPRVGGIGIVLGALLTIVVWSPMDQPVMAYLIGAIIILLFGAWDDARNLSPYAKLAAQIVAASCVVYIGEVYVRHIPFLDFYSVPDFIAKPFTVFGLVGVINALNTSDGLDGLAGGEALLSLGVVAWLAYSANGYEAMIIALSTIGGLFGFLRFNSHPAKVFMGDGGSQYLGFSLGFLVVWLTQEVNTALNPAIALLILGLPVIDLIAVMIHRASHGMSLIRPSKTHLHHRIMDIGFSHYDAVVIIYLVQTGFVLAALFMRYESDLLIVTVYAAACAALFSWIRASESRAMRAGRGSPGKSRIAWSFEVFKNNMLVREVPVWVVRIGVPLFMLAAALNAESVPSDIGVSAAIVSALLLLRLIYGYRLWFLFLRMLLYVSVALAVYISGPVLIDGEFGTVLTYAIFGVLLLSIIIAMKLSSEKVFEITPLDYLVGFAVLALATMPDIMIGGSGELEWMLLEMIILYYATELVIKHMKTRWNGLTISTLVSLGIIVTRALT